MEDFNSLLIALATATGLSGLIGLEREMRLQNNLEDESPLGGLRTFAMMGTIGFVGAFLSIKYEVIWFLPLLLLISMAFPLITHSHFVFREKQFGEITAFSLIISFCIGVLVAFDETFFAISLSILFTAILALRDVLHKMAKKISYTELFAILQFLILTAIILPILPTQLIDPIGFFDWRPRTIWLMIVFVASIRFIGYFLAKFISGEKSILFSGIIGGFVSSTAVTTGISQESKGKKETLIFLAPILVATGIMFFRVLFEVVIVTQGKTALISLLIWPLISAGVSALLLTLAIILYRKHGKVRAAPLHIDQPLQMKSAISFGLFFLVILLISEKVPEYFNQSGLYFTGAIAGLTDIDAITLAMSNLVYTNGLGADIAARVILLAALVNTFVKLGIVYVFGSRQLFRLLSLSIIGIVLVGAATYFVSTMLVV